MSVIATATKANTKNILDTIMRKLKLPSSCTVGVWTLELQVRDETVQFGIFLNRYEVENALLTLAAHETDKDGWEITILKWTGRWQPSASMYPHLDGDEIVWSKEIDYVKVPAQLNNYVKDSFKA